jgi:hypothetical protein
MSAYIVVEPGASIPAAAGTAFLPRAGETLRAFFTRVERAVQAERRGPVALRLELGPDTGRGALEDRLRLLVALAPTLSARDGRLTFGAAPGPALWMAHSLAEWVRASLLGASWAVDVVERDGFARAA